jgi:tRNA 2-thiouridine synthesizing protein D
MELIVMIQSVPGTQAPATALRFARAAIAGGHRIRQVFCHGDGVAALAPIDVPADELDVGAAWRELATTHGFSVLACATAATRRGLPERDDAAAMATHGTLGQLMAALDDGVRVVTFAG